MLDIAASGGAEKPVPGQPIDGRSLWDMAASGKDDDGEAIGEYCAEMTADPVIMIRRGRYKYIHCDSDAPLLYDIEADPMEKHNLTDDPAHADLAAAFAAEIAEGWNMAVIKADVMAKQKAASGDLCRNAIRGSGLTGITTRPAMPPKNMCAITWTGPKPRQKRAIRRWLTDHHQDR